MKTNDTPNSRLVYSTEQGGTCPVCNKRLDRCRCHQSATRGTGDGIVRIRRATQGRKGKAVSVISGVPGDAETLKAVAKTLKQKCGSGGTVKAGSIEIQGDHRELIMDELKRMGYRVR
ncbi:conserved hypothetical protein [Desulfosarcina cetonica]|nr:conserved hypothetical protein [Desulfosarcina cetonica]